jgi:uncharacterized protein (DUF488 family)
MILTVTIFELWRYGSHMKTRTLITIGYEGRTLREYIDLLQKNAVAILCDVRKNPISRKKGFSKNQLCTALAAKNIEYKHYAALGIASDLRKDAKMTTEKLFAIYREKILRTDTAKSACAELIGLIQNNANVAITCFELDHRDCHRSHLAKALQDMEKFKVINI